MYTYNAKVVRIIDGDTIIVNIDLGFYTWLFNQSIRLYGIDAPEIRTKNTLEKEAGILAKELIENYIQPGDSIILKTILDKSEKFGRILGIINTENGINLNEKLIEENLAIPYIAQSNELLKEQHEANLKILLDKKIIGQK